MVSQVAVNWHEVDGSKLIQSKWDIVTTSLSMARDMLCVRLCYLFGIWRIALKSPGSGGSGGKRVKE
jgi:dolichyl-phosphate beta-glucosyltransferase